MSNFQEKVKNFKTIIKITIRKRVQERKIDPSPTHYSKFDKYTENRETNPDWFEICNYIALPIPLGCPPWGE